MKIPSIVIIAQFVRGSIARVSRFINGAVRPETVKYPCPATIDIKPEYIGRHAVEQLCWRIQYPDNPATVEFKLKPELEEKFKQVRICQMRAVS